MRQEFVGKLFVKFVRFFRVLQIAYPAGMSADVRTAIDMEMPLGTLTNDDHAKSAVFSLSLQKTIACFEQEAICLRSGRTLR